MKQILVERGEVNKIAELMGFSREMVCKSLRYKKNTDVAKRIRKMAVERGGKLVEVKYKPLERTAI
jgi:predicted transcriptional regulator